MKSSIIHNLVRILIVIFIVAVLITPFFCSCNNAMTKIEHSRTLPSAYTHTGKYVQSNRLLKKHDSIAKEKQKCSIPFNKK